MSIWTFLQVFSNNIIVTESERDKYNEDSRKNKTQSVQDLLCTFHKVTL